MSDDEYRDTLEMVAGCRSSTDPRMTDRHLDQLLAYIEAIFWRGMNAGTLQPAGSRDAVFKKPGFWKSRNPAGETSRDRFTGRNQGAEISDLEAKMNALGFGPAYLNAIRDKVCHGSTEAHALHLYAAALQRTLKAKARRATPAENPF